MRTIFASPSRSLVAVAITLCTACGDDEATGAGGSGGTTSSTTTSSATTTSTSTASTGATASASSGGTASTATGAGGEGTGGGAGGSGGDGTGGDGSGGDGSGGAGGGTGGAGSGGAAGLGDDVILGSCAGVICACATPTGETITVSADAQTLAISTNGRRAATGDFGESLITDLATAAVTELDAATFPVTYLDAERVVALRSGTLQILGADGEIVASGSGTVGGISPWPRSPDGAELVFHVASPSFAIVTAPVANPAQTTPLVDLGAGVRPIWLAGGQIVWIQDDAGTATLRAIDPDGAAPARTIDLERGPDERLFTGALYPWGGEDEVIVLIVDVQSGARQWKIVDTSTDGLTDLDWLGAYGTAEGSRILVDRARERVLFDAGGSGPFAITDLDGDNRFDLLCGIDDDAPTDWSRRIR